MEKFHCYICLTDVECVFAKQVCSEQKHQVCSQCYPLVNKDKCPMCRQPNPNYMPIVDNDSDADDYSADSDDTMLLDHLTRQQILHISYVDFMIQFQQLALSQNLQIQFQGQNAGDANGWQ